MKLVRSRWLERGQSGREAECPLHNRRHAWESMNVGNKIKSWTLMGFEGCLNLLEFINHFIYLRLNQCFVFPDTSRNEIDFSCAGCHSPQCLFGILRFNRIRLFPFESTLRRLPI